MKILVTISGLSLPLILNSCGSPETLKKESIPLEYIDTLTLDSIHSSIIIHQGLDKKNSIKKIIYQNGEDILMVNIIGKNTTAGDTVLLIPDTNNGGDTYRYQIVSSIDSGMSISIDKFSNKFIVNSENGNSINSLELLK